MRIWANPAEMSNGVFVPEWLLCRMDMSAGAKLCYTVLKKRANGYECTPPLADVADSLGVSRRQAWSYVNELVKCGVVIKVRRGANLPNQYFFADMNKYTIVADSEIEFEPDVQYPYIHFEPEVQYLYTKKAQEKEKGKGLSLSPLAPPFPLTNPFPPISPHSLVPKAKEKESMILQTEKNEIEIEFEKFCKIYPKRFGGHPKADARKRYARAILAGCEPHVIARGAEMYRRVCEDTGNIGTPYVKMMSTWLNQRCWEDDYSDVKTPSYGKDASEAVNPFG